MPGILSPLSKTAQVFCVSLFFLMGVDLLRASPNIIISEIHFNPNGPDEAREFIEIKNEKKGMKTFGRSCHSLLGRSYMSFCPNACKFLGTRRILITNNRI